MATVKIQVQSEGFAAAQAAFDALSKAEQKAVLSGSAIGNALKDSGKKGKESLSSLALTAVGLGTGMELASRGIGFVTGALKKMHDERERGARLTTESTSSLGQLAQLAGGDSRRLAKMIESAKKTSLETGIPLDQAASLQFSLESAGIGDQRQAIAKLAPAVGGENLAEFAEKAAGVQSAFGAGETGGIANVINKLLVASEGSPTKVQDIAKSTAILAPSARGLLKTTDEETMAAIAKVAPAAGGSSEVAATQLQAFATAAAKENLKGDGFVGRAQGLAQRGLSEKALIEKLGSVEAVKGFQNLMLVADQVVELTKKLKEADANTGGNKDVSTMMVNSFMQQPGNSQSVAFERAKRQNEIAMTEKVGPDQLAINTAIEQQKTASIDQGFLKKTATGAFSSAFGFVEENFSKPLGIAPGTLTSQAAEMGSRSVDLGVNSIPAVVILQEIASLLRKSNDSKATPKAGMEID